MTVSRVSGGAVQGRQWLAIRAATVEPIPFEAPLRGVAHTVVDLGGGLRARVPLVLTDAEAQVT
ncbi:hypothetical protein Q8G71_34900, partial [Klebsiella pneumoniae]